MPWAQTSLSLHLHRYLSAKSQVSQPGASAQAPALHTCPAQLRFGPAALTSTKFYARCDYAGTAQLQQCNEEDKLCLCLSLTLKQHEASCKTDKHWHWAHDKHPKEFTQAAATKHNYTRLLNVNYKHSHRRDITFSSSSTFKQRCIVCNAGCWKGFSLSKCSSAVFYAHWQCLIHPK